MGAKEPDNAQKWPVLHYSSLPHVDLARWTFRVFGEVGRPFEITWDEFAAMPRHDVL